MKENKIIYHIDVDSFFVSAEYFLRPELIGKDIVISYNKPNSIILSLSYSSKQKGLKVPMKLSDAKNLIPNLIVIKPNYVLYEYLSKKIFNYLKNNYTKNIEVGSIDEWYLDLTHFKNKYKTPFELANKIKNNIFNEFNINISIGISYNKFLAKMATDMAKPNGIEIIRKKDIKEKIWPLSIDSYIGIGKSLSKKLVDEKIETIGQLANIDKKNAKFRKIFKNKIDYYVDNANGINGDNKIVNDKNNVSISFQLTFENKEISTLKQIYNKIKFLSKKISTELEKKDLMAKNISIHLKYLDKKNVSISKTLKLAINDIDTIYHYSTILFKKIWNEESVYMLSISTSSLISKFENYENASLFTTNNKNNKFLDNIIDETNKKIKKQKTRLFKDVN